VESDPMVLAGARATIEPVTDLVRVVEGDVREFDAILDDRVVRSFLDWDRPMAVLLLSTYSLNDDEYFHYVIKRLRQVVPDHSYLSLLQTTFDAIPPELLPAIHDLLATLHPRDLPPFRVVDDVTRAASLAPVSTGLILYNLTAQRIVQVQNSYCSLLRRDRGRIRASGRPTRHLYRYELPSEWSLVP